MQENVRGTVPEQARKKNSSAAAAVKEPDLDRLPAADLEDDQWEAERRIAKQHTGRPVKYLVKWLGYPNSENTWEKGNDIDTEIAMAFEAELLLGLGTSLDNYGLIPKKKQLTSTIFPFLYVGF